MNTLVNENNPICPACKKTMRFVAEVNQDFKDATAYDCVCSPGQLAVLVFGELQAYDIENDIYKRMQPGETFACL